jgi:hypothetical protein
VSGVRPTALSASALCEREANCIFDLGKIALARSEFDLAQTKYEEALLL